MNLDLKNFHKIETNNTHTTLEHASGHQLVIAHSGLSDEKRKQLEEMPTSLAKGGYAKFAQANDPNIKAAKAAKAAKSTNTMPGSPTQTKGFTEPNAMGTSIPKQQLEDEMTNGQQPDVVVQALSRKAPPFGPLSSKPKQHYPPCINPSCKSYGKSHPNCLCYGGGSEHSGVGVAGHFAEGGEVSEEYYCDNNRPHFKKCEYYAEGGSVKGVHTSSMDVERPFNRTEKPWAGESKAGDLVRNSDIRKVSSTSAKDEHHKVLGEMKAMPKPKLQGLAEGGEAEPEVIQKDQSPDPANMPVDQANMQSAEQPEEPSADVPQGTPEPVLAPELTPGQNPAKVDPYQAYQQQSSTMNQLLNDDHNKYVQEVDSGQIQPKTMQELFHDKNLPGKIGTIFGMLVSGAGAGLNHTDNALLTSMQKEIDRDLASQEQNQANRRNLMSINGQNLMNLANAGKIGTDTRAAQIAMSKAQANYYLYNQLAQQAQNLSNPQQAQKAGQILALMRNAMDKDNASAFAQAAGANALGQLMRGGNTAALKTGLLGPEMQEYGNDIESKAVPGVGMASRPVPEDMRRTLTSQQNLDMKLKDLQDYVKKNVGTADWTKYPIAKQKAMEAIRMYSSTLGGPNGQGKLDDLEKQIAGGKNPLNPIKYLLGQPGRIQEIRDANQMQYQNNMQSVGIKGKPLQSNLAPASKRQSQSAVQTATNPKTGEKMTLKNGKWVSVNG